MKFDYKKEMLVDFGLVILLFFSFFIDRSVYVFNDIASLYLTHIFLGITELGEFLIVLIIAGIALYRTKWFKSFLLSLFGAGVIGMGLKFLIQRPRPFGLEFFPFGFIDYSFPSLHAIAAVVGLIFLDKAYPKFRIVWIVLGGLILFSRVYLGLHYFSDVVIGGIIAYFTAKVVLQWNWK